MEGDPEDDLVSEDGFDPMEAAAIQHRYDVNLKRRNHIGPPILRSANPNPNPDGTGEKALFWDESSLVYTYYLPGSIFAPPKPGSAPRGMYYLAAWGALLFFRMPLAKSDKISEGYRRIHQ